MKQFPPAHTEREMKNSSGNFARGGINSWKWFLCSEGLGFFGILLFCFVRFDFRCVGKEALGGMEGGMDGWMDGWVWLMCSAWLIDRCSVEGILCEGGEKRERERERERESSYSSQIGLRENSTSLYPRGFLTP